MYTIKKANLKQPGILECEFSTVDNISIEDYFSIYLLGKSRYFSIVNIHCSDKSEPDMKVTIIETGYLANKIGKIKDFDIRVLIGADIRKVTDEDEIQKILEESRYT